MELNYKDKKLYEPTYPQKSIILTDEFYDDKHISVITGWCHIKENIDLDLLEKALNKLYENNDAYRLNFVKKDNEFMQFIKEYSYINFERLEINDVSDLHDYAKNVTFDIYNDYLIKFTLFKDKNNFGGFTCSIHHSVSDAWTISLMLEDVLKCYNKLKDNEPIDDIRKSSYIDFMDAEQKYLTSDKFLKDKLYWENIFSTPVDHSIFRKSSNIFDTHSKRKSYTFPSFVNEYCKTEKVSPFSLCFGALSLYLTRIQNLKEITIGTPVLNRTNFMEKNTSGMCISTLPYRNIIDFNLSAKDYIKSISTNQLGILRHQKYPYTELQDYYAKKFGRTNNLYDILFSYQNARTKLQESNLDFETKWVFTGHQAEALAVNVYDMDNTGTLLVDYDYLISAFSEEEINNMHFRIVSILEQIIANPDMLLKDIDIVTAEEKDILINKFNETKKEYNRNLTISKLFEESIKKYPNEIALIYEDKKITYSELNNKVNILASILKSNGVKNSNVIGLMFYRSFEMIIAMLAVLKLGAAYLPLDPAYPKERIDYILKDSNCNFLLKSNDISFKNEDIRTLNVSEKYLKSNFKLKLKNTSSPSDLAYIIYTSGSTGKPKGVLIKNSNIINTLLWRKELYKFNTKTVVLQIPSFSFDSSVEDIFTPLISGGKLVLLKQNNTNFNIPLMKELILKYKANNMLVVPSFYNVLLNELSENLKNFKHIIVAGEGFSSELVKKHFELLPNVELYNEYGPTENSVCSTFYKFSKDDTDVFIGKPINNCKCYVLDENLKVVPFDVKGELYVSGPGVSLGYIGREDLNKERFLKNPFHENFLMYKTGDIVTINKDGNMTFIERADYQVKYNGYRINLGEIESTISKYLKNPNVVVLIKKKGNSSALTAYVETTENINTNDLKRELKKFLTHYMIPKEIVLINKFPSTPNGKIDRKALENYVSNNNEHREIVEPRNELDKKIINIWQIVLKQNNFGIDDNIFDLGGDSLSIISIQSALFRENIKVRSQDLFEHPTIRTLSNKISNATINLYDKEKQFERIYKDNETEIKKVEYIPKHVLLTGVTGFLGAHILAELINTYPDINVYCIIRSKPNKTHEDRLKEILKYYFDDKYDLLINKNIIPIEGDLSREKLGIDITTYKNLVTKVDTIINSASLVKHFGIYDLFYNSNVLSVKNLIDFAKESNSTLNHISTTSVSGNFLVKNNIEYDYTENDFYIGQNYEDNAYVRTKFEAESLIFEEQKNGLNANIFRMGNIMPRIKDGKFQINKMDNAYYKRIKGFLELKYLPDNMKNQELEFTPVDSSAEAIIKLMPYNNKVFHLLNNNTINISSFIKVAKNQNKNIEFVSPKEFSDYIHQINDDSILDSFITDLDNNEELNYDTKIIINNELTNKYLKTLGFTWPNITEDYLDRFLML